MDPQREVLARNAPGGPPTGDRRPGWPFWLACGVALALRLATLDVRPLHHDEALNAWLLRDLVQGRGYAYNPYAYHGPFLCLFGALLAWLPYRLFGEAAFATFALRLPVALASALMIPLLLPFRRWLGKRGLTASAWVMALSPSLVFYGRDLIHETYLALATLGLAAAGALWLQHRRRGELLVVAAVLALLFTIKETAILAVASLILAGLATIAARDGWTALRAPRTALGPLPGAVDLAWAAALFAAIWSLSFSTFFTHPAGIVDAVRAYLPWLGKGVSGAQHGKPWSYFLGLALAHDRVIAQCGVALTLWSLGTGTRRARGISEDQRASYGFGLFCTVWAWSQLAIYSAIPYKTPWLIVNVAVPVAVGTGSLFAHFRVDGLTPFARQGGLFLLLILGLGAGLTAYDGAALHYDDPKNGLVYSDTTREIWPLLQTVRTAVSHAPEPKAVTLEAYLPSRWPLLWYLRDLSDGDREHWRKTVERLPEAAIVLADRSQDAALRPLLERGYQRKEFLLRPGYPVAVWIRSDLGARVSPGERSPPPRRP